MTVSVESDVEHGWIDPSAGPEGWDKRSEDGSQAWLGLLLMIGSSAVAIRGLCWMTAGFIRLVH